MNNGIVAIGYNRLESLKRLLMTLKRVDYKEDRVTLIISLDFNENNDVKDFASKFQWPYGDKILRFSHKKLGLRRHVLQCGNYLNEYNLDAIAVFEDDIVPSVAFYNYMRQAVAYYQNVAEVAGIALYSFRINQNGQLKFEPAKSKFDTYFIQFACSWGQIWTRRQWNDFYEWYKRNENAFFVKNELPQNVCDWPESSWLKYQIKYCVEKEKFFVYPYNALSTNFNEAGTHISKTNDMFQVPIADVVDFSYNFASMDTGVKYDVFFERMDLGKYVFLDDEHLCVDLYGRQPDFQGKRYWISSIQANYRILKKYAACMYPKEENVIYDIAGEGIYLYDTYVYIDNNWNNQDIDPYINRGMDWVLEQAYKKARDFEKKHLEMFRLVNCWLQKIQEGKDIIRYFEENDVHTIAIYGLGEIGKTLTMFLQHSNIVIRYGIDRNARLIHAYPFPVITIEETIEVVDLIIVTTFYDYDKIKESLEKKTISRIMSLVQIIEDM